MRMRSNALSQPKIIIVILNWNRPYDTLECLESLKKIDYPHYEVIVVDNGSSDDSVFLIKQTHPELCLIESEDNLGFAAGSNLGMKKALEKGAEFILLLNNDTIVHPKILSAFAKAAKENPQAAVFGAKIYYYDEPTTLWYAGGNVTPSGRCYHIGCGQCDLEKKREKIEKTNYACGCALLIKSAVISEVGMLCEDFFLIWEEIDWCWRIRKAGFDCLFVPEAKVWHKISASFEGGNKAPQWHYYYWRNRLLFLEKHWNFKRRLSFYMRIFPKELFFIFGQLSKSKENHILYKASLKGIRDYLLRRFGKGSLHTNSK